MRFSSYYTKAGCPALPIRGDIIDNSCSLCAGSGEVINRPVRLIGATYWENDNGDERLEPCPICSLEGDKDKKERTNSALLATREW